MSQFELIDETGASRFRGSQRPPGGGSQPVQFDIQNGLLVNYTPPGGTDDLRILELVAAPIPWTPGAVGQAQSIPDEGHGRTGSPTLFVNPDDPPNPGFVYWVRTMLSGGSAPAFPQVSDEWTARDGDTSGVYWRAIYLWEGTWQATTAFVSAITAVGNLWLSDVGGSSGGSEPDWSTAPNPGDTISDGAITWTNTGPCAEWQADTTYLVIGNGGVFQPNVLPPSAVANTDYVFGGWAARGSADMGDTPPAFTPGDTPAGDAIVSNAAGLVAPILTGLAAPATSGYLLLRALKQAGTTLVDEANVVATYDDEGESDPANRFDFGGTDVVLGAPAEVLLHYDTDAARWSSV